MKNPNTHTRQCKSTLRQPLLALAYALVIGAMAMAPTLADDHGNHQGNWDNGRGNGGYHGNGHGYHEQGHGYRPSYNYRQPYIYAPPPVYYAPVPSPGINLVFPLHIR